MKILITGTTGNSLPPPYGGIPKLVLMSAREWKKAGHDVAITFSYFPEKGDDFGVNAEYFYEYKKEPKKVSKVLFLIRYLLRNPKLYFILLKSHYILSPHISAELILACAYGVYLDGIFEKFRPDIVLGQAALIKTFMAAEIANRRNIPIIYDVYAEVREGFMGENKYLTENARKLYWTEFLNKADLVLGMDNCSVELRSYLSDEKLKEFWDTGDYVFYSQKIPMTRHELREYFKLPQQKFLVGAVGMFELRKGHDHLIRAVAALAKQGYDIGVVICGGSPKGVNKWKEVAKEHGLEDGTFFFSSLSELDLAKLHRAINVYTNLSNTQRMCGYDLALIEAMSSGLPLVVYENGALPKTVSGGNGYVVPMNKISGVSEAILKCYNLTEEERVVMGNISAEFASKIDIRITAGIKLGWFEDVIKARLN
jgi:glycosyltransferase involved in cell wall biosynthesis